MFNYTFKAEFATLQVLKVLSGFINFFFSNLWILFHRQSLTRCGWCGSSSRAALDWVSAAAAAAAEGGQVSGFLKELCWWRKPPANFTSPITCDINVDMW